MTARAALQTLLEGDSVLHTIGFSADSVFPTNAVDTPPADLFLIVRWDPTAMAFSNRGTTRFTIWAHDREKDYGRITAALNRLRVLIPAQTHLKGSDGWTLTTADWLGEGPDLFDSGYETLTRYADFQAATRYDGVV